MCANDLEPKNLAAAFESKKPRSLGRKKTTKSIKHVLISIGYSFSQLKEVKPASYKITRKNGGVTCRNTNKGFRK